MRVWSASLISLAVVTSMVAPLPATTLEQLTLDEMIQKSTAIVRARVTGSHSGHHGANRGADIYTYFDLHVLETWKSSGRATTQVAIPGGVADGIRQSVAGAPELKFGQEYILFLWTSRSGLTQVIGLSQGRFNLSEDGSGGAVAQRPPASELILDGSGNPVDDHALSLRVEDLRARVLQRVGAPK
ncbi:MAG: hypothetical protein JWO19_4139 [Bryobacterales bacterium]|nr:hypothetical protein [Bryobacterales bacterium]